MSDNDEMIQQFIDVTGCTRERTEFFLQAANWDLQAAISSFYEAEEDEMGENQGAEREAVAQPVIQPVPEKPGKPSEKPKSTSRFATLKNLESSSEDEEDDEKGQTFYAGGSEHSGQQIVGPPRKNPIRDMVSDIFRSARDGNMENFDPDDAPTAGSSRGQRFSGVGYRLGETDDDTVAINSGANAGARGARPESDTVTVKVYRQGFTVDDGELRPYDDPKNKEFFECIMRKEIPAEFRKQGARMVHLNVEDHLHDEFVKTGPKFKAFTGSGHTLGSPTPATAQEAAASMPDLTDTTGNPQECEARAVSQLNVDQSQPNTMIQIRLADGSRLSARLNLSHTVQDIRNYVATARPQYASHNFTLLTTFPNKELADGSETIEKAGLKGAAILQRLK